MCVSETVSEEGSRLLELIQSTKLTTVDVKYIMDVLSMQTGAMTFWTKVGRYLLSLLQSYDDRCYCSSVFKYNNVNRRNR